MPNYRKMLVVFDEVREGHFGVKLTFEGLQRIAAAKEYSGHQNTKNEEAQPYNGWASSFLVVQG